MVVYFVSYKPIKNGNKNSKIQIKAAAYFSYTPVNYLVSTALLCGVETPCKPLASDCVLKKMDCVIGGAACFESGVGA